jgi:hypothetical protein
MLVTDQIFDLAKQGPVEGMRARKIKRGRAIVWGFIGRNLQEICTLDRSVAFPRCSIKPAA